MILPLPTKTLLSMLCLAFSFYTGKGEDRTKDLIESIELVNSVLFSNNDPKEKKATLQRIHYKYIIAESGLNYRDAPNGKVLGKFDWRDKVHYLFDTDFKQKITDNYWPIEGYWVALKHKQDTVFVFGPFLSDQEPQFSRINLYYAQAAYEEKLQPSGKMDRRRAFVNVSESFRMPENFIQPKDLRKDTIDFSKQQKTEFLRRMNYANSDTLFIYDLSTGLVKKHPIRQMPIMACVSIYSQVSEEYKDEDYSTWDYQIGFNLGKSKHEGFAMIGSENPFVEKGLEPMEFEKMSQKEIDENVKNNIIPEVWKNDSVYKPFFYSYENMYAVVRIDQKTNDWQDLIFKNLRTKESYSIYQAEGESSSKASLKLKDGKNQNEVSYQFVGSLFKNKPPVSFGYMWESFDCPKIHFLDKDELPIYIQCDNRH